MFFSYIDRTMADRTQTRRQTNGRVPTLPPHFDLPPSEATINHALSLPHLTIVADSSQQMARQVATCAL